MVEEEEVGDMFIEGTVGEGVKGGEKVVRRG